MEWNWPITGLNWPSDDLAADQRASGGDRPYRPSPHTTVPADTGLCPHWRHKFPRFNVELALATGTCYPPQGATSFIDGAVELLEVGKVGGEHVLDYTAVNAIHFTQPGDDPGENQYGQVGFIALDPGIRHSFRYA